MSRPVPVFLALLMLVATAEGVSAGGRAMAGHDKHVSFGQMGVEGRVAVIRIRFFRHDLEAALRRHHGDAALQLDASPRLDSLFADYFDAHFQVAVHGDRLSPRVLSTGEDDDLWWAAVRFDAPEPLAAFTLRNTLLFDVFPSQRNTVKVARFPGGRSETLYFTRGAASYDVS